MRTLMDDGQLARLLRGSVVVVRISEPFGFAYPEGSAAGLRAEVAEVSLDDGAAGGHEIALDLTEPFRSEEGVRISRLKATARYEEDASMVRLLAAGEHVSANFSYADQVPAEKRMPGKSPGLIGGIDLAQ